MTSAVDDVDDPGAGHGHDSAADSGLDLTPRTSGPTATAPAGALSGRRRNPAAWLALAAVVIAIGYVVVQGLGNATLYFHNADEALAEREDLGTRSFRLQGLVRDDVREEGDTVVFTVTFNGADVPVIHRGDPPDLFRPGLPVVLEGHFIEGADTFESNRILVKHSEEYEAENTDRIVDAEDGREDGDGGLNQALGRAGVVLGLAAAVFGAVTVAVGLATDRPAVRASAKWYALLVLGGAALAVLAMERALITRDFSIEYVAENGSTKTPALYNVATLWAALEGSILLWGLVLSGYLVATTAKFRRRLEDPLVGWALLTIFVVAAFFFMLLVGPANPFRASVLSPGFVDGPGPNPLLQNHPLMAIHPPMLYLGYVGFTVPFAFAIAALATGRLGEGWLVATRRWTLVAWGFLTVGIVLGAWWSYEVLGWGGYWAWDPVENASFLPWLTGTAFLHSVMVQERRGMLRVWNLSLVCATFALTILGTFLTRSGVLDSVHAFTESLIGPFLLGFFALIVVVTCGLVAWRGDELRSPGRVDAVLSREAGFLLNNLLFAAFAFVVLLGTVFPLLVEALTGDRITVGEPYFDTMAIPIGLALLFLMAVAPVLPWRKASTETVAARLHWPAWIGTCCVLLAVLLGARGLAPLIAFGLGGFAAGAALRQVVLATRRQGWRGLVGRTNGGMVVHLGVVLIGVGLAASSSYATEREVTLAEGAVVTVAGHTFELVGTEVDVTPARTESRALISIDGGQTYTPAVQEFGEGTQTIGTPSVRTTPFEDVYLSLLPGADPAAGTVNVRVIVSPLVAWLWAGGLVMFVGTMLAAFPGRRRNPLDPVSADVPERELVGAGAPQ